MEDVHKNLLIGISFMKIGAVKAILYSEAYKNFYLYFPHLLSDLGEDMHIMLLSMYDFHANQQGECHTFLMSINEITFVYVL
jgi:hypothetical protein